MFKHGQMLYCVVKAFIIASLLIISLACVSAERECDGVYLNDKYYDKEILKENLTNVYQMAVKRNDNILYYIYDKSNPLDQNIKNCSVYSWLNWFGLVSKHCPARLLGYIDIYTNTSGSIEGIKYPTCIAIDQTRNIVYIGALDAVYRLNSLNVPEKLNLHHGIQSMYFKHDVLYYTNRRNELWKYNVNKFYPRRKMPFWEWTAIIAPVYDLGYVGVQRIMLDVDNNIFFTMNSTSKLCRAKVNSTQIFMYDQFGENFTMSTDLDDKAYITGPDGVYSYNKEEWSFDKVFNLTELKALAFTKDGEPVYAFNDVIVHLEYNPRGCQP